MAIRFAVVLLALLVSTSAYGREIAGVDVPETLSQALGPQLYHLVETLTEEHRTPNGGLQQFVYCRFRQK